MGSTSLGDVIKDYAPFQVKATAEIETQSHEEALKLALEARLVWPGLTALVTTTTTNSCLFEETSKNICPNDGIALKSAQNKNHFVQEDMIAGGASIQSMSSTKTMMMIQKPKVPKMNPVPPKVPMAPLSPPTQHPTFDINE